MFLVAATTISHVADHVTRVSVHGDEGHELCTERLVDGRHSDHTDEAAEVLYLRCVALLHGILLAALEVEESLLTVDDPVTVVQEQQHLRRRVLDPLKLVARAHRFHLRLGDFFE